MSRYCNIVVIVWTGLTESAGNKYMYGLIRLADKKNPLPM